MDTSATAESLFELMTCRTIHAAAQRSCSRGTASAYFPRLVTSMRLQVSLRFVP